MSGALQGELLLHSALACVHPAPLNRPVEAGPPAQPQQAVDTLQRCGEIPGCQTKQKMKAVLPAMAWHGTGMGLARGWARLRLTRRPSQTSPWWPSGCGPHP